MQDEDVLLLSVVAWCRFVQWWRTREKDQLVLSTRTWLCRRFTPIRPVLVVVNIETTLQIEESVLQHHAEKRATLFL